MKRPLVLYLLVSIHILLSLGAFYGGWMLLFDPPGLGVRTEWLAGSPFDSFLVPGLVLLIFNGFFPLLIALGLLSRPEWRTANAFNIYTNRHWAWTYSLFSGIILIIWITVQLTVVPSFWLQPVYLAVGVSILICTLWPAVMRYFEKNK